MYCNHMFRNDKKMTPSEIEKLIAEGLPTHPWGNAVFEQNSQS